MGKRTVKNQLAALEEQMRTSPPEHYKRLATKRDMLLERITSAIDKPRPARRVAVIKPQTELDVDPDDEAARIAARVNADRARVAASTRRITIEETVCQRSPI